jgi:hypothetical protein
MAMTFVRPMISTLVAALISPISRLALWPATAFSAVDYRSRRLYGSTSWPATTAMRLCSADLLEVIREVGLR